MGTLCALCYSPLLSGISADFRRPAFSKSFMQYKYPGVGALTTESKSGPCASAGKSRAMPAFTTYIICLVIKQVFGKHNWHRKSLNTTLSQQLHHTLTNWLCRPTQDVVRLAASSGCFKRLLLGCEHLHIERPDPHLKMADTSQGSPLQGLQALQCRCCIPHRTRARHNAQR